MRGTTKEAAAIILTIIVIGFFALYGYVKFQEDDLKPGEVAATASDSSAKALMYLETANERLDDLYEMVQSGRCARNSVACKDLMDDISGELNEATEVLKSSEKEMNSIQFETED